MGEVCPYGPSVACRVACIAPLVAPASGEGSDPWHAVTVERSTRRFSGGVGLREQFTPASLTSHPSRPWPQGCLSSLPPSMEEKWKTPLGLAANEEGFGLATVPSGRRENWFSPRLRQEPRTGTMDNFARGSRTPFPFDLGPFTGTGQGEEGVAWFATLRDPLNEPTSAEKGKDRHGVTVKKDDLFAALAERSRCLEERRRGEGGVWHGLFLLSRMVYKARPGTSALRALRAPVLSRCVTVLWIHESDQRGVWGQDRSRRRPKKPPRLTAQGRGFFVLLVKPPLFIWGIPTEGSDCPAGPGRAKRAHVTPLRG